MLRRIEILVRRKHGDTLEDKSSYYTFQKGRKKGGKGK